MIYTETKLQGAIIIDIDKSEDNRGFFARTFCVDEFNCKGLCTDFSQCSIAFNINKGTIRGMHFQISPSEEIKIVRCTKGKIYDVIIDLRNNSPTFKNWVAVELNETNRRMLYIPEGFAHGYQTLEDNTEVFYQISEFYNPVLSRGIRWDDPEFNIKWVLESPTINERDKNFKLWKDDECVEYFFKS